MSQFEIQKSTLLDNSMETQKANDPIVIKKEKKKEKVNIPLPNKNSEIVSNFEIKHI